MSSPSGDNAGVDLVVVFRLAIGSRSAADRSTACCRNRSFTTELLLLLFFPVRQMLQYLSTQLQIFLRPIFHTKIQDINNVPMSEEDGEIKYMR